MLYSKDHNFLLLKNHKVGGTSLENDLSKNLPINAVVTPKTSNHPEWYLGEDLDNEYLPRNFDNFYNHISYKEVSYYIDLTGVLSYVFVRNPYDAVLSHFFHRLKMKKLLTSWEQNKDQYLDKYFNNELGWGWYKSSKNIYTIDNEVVVTKILKYEDGIENEINPILKQHGIKEIQLTSNEKAFRPSTTIPEEVFKKQHFDIINNEWEWEFKNLGYKRI
jgi:hypothetical protein